MTEYRHLEYQPDYQGLIAPVGDKVLWLSDSAPPGVVSNTDIGDIERAVLAARLRAWADRIETTR